MSNEKEVLVSVQGLTKEFAAQASMWSNKKQVVHAVNDVTLDIYKGETLALVGESGCGKSTLGRLIISLLKPTSGKVVFNGTDLGSLSDEELRQNRKNMQMIFQDPFASLNPRWTIRRIVEEPLKTHGMFNASEEERTKRVRELLSVCGIRPEFMDRYPHQFSGGQRQRVAIARALALNPELIVCDEPVSALDVSIQAQVLNLLGKLQRDYNLTYLFISHDLSVVRYLSDRVCVMFLGRVCELGTTRDVYENPLHPYTKFLLDAIPLPDPDLRKEDKDMLTGEIPSPVNPPSGCLFHTRCPYCTERCKTEVPELKTMPDGRKVACHLVE